MKRVLLAIASTAIATGAIATSANATSLLYNFGSVTGDLTSTHTYISDGLKIIATGYDASKTPKLTDLWGKSAGKDEIGLGLQNDPQHEIAFGKGFVQLNVSALFGKVNPNTVSFLTNSATNGEEWGVFGSNTAGSYSTLNMVREGMVETATTLPGATFGKFKYYDFVEVSDPKNQGDNFLINSLTATTAVPEPATWAMMLAGFAGMGAALRRSRRTAATATA